MTAIYLTAGVLLTLLTVAISICVAGYCESTLAIQEMENEQNKE